MSGHKLQAGKPTPIVHPPASQYARPVEDGGPAADVLEDLLAVCRHPAVGVQVVSRRRRWPPTPGRIRTVFRSSFAGPRSWHGGVMLRRAELWLCSHSSLSGRICHHSSAPVVRFAAAIDTPVSGDVQTPCPPNTTVALTLTRCFRPQI